MMLTDFAGGGSPCLELVRISPEWKYIDDVHRQNNFSCTKDEMRSFFFSEALH